MAGTVTAAERRTALTRERILAAALDYVDEHGLAALSMHKLAAGLGVSGMSLYNHIADKDALLDGIVELLWQEVADDQPTDADWHTTLRHLGQSIRAMLHRHPKAVPLPLTRAALTTPMLRAYHRALRATTDSGIGQAEAVELLRTVVGYAFGCTLTELSALCAAQGETEMQRYRRLSPVLPDDLPDDLLTVAMTVCGDCDTTAHFATGLDLIINRANRR
jgi:AcrR family transcriptional regulator